MSATMQPHLISEIAAKFGRSGFSKSISMPPIRPNLSIALKLTSDTRAYVTKDLVKQEKGERAIIFCLFKSNVLQMARHIEKAFPTRPVFQCTSGKDEDLALFNSAPSGIMVCTKVLAAGASFENVTSVYFCDCSHGPECLLQGAGRGARSENENCVATLVTTKQQLEYFIESSMGHAAKMASFCKDCVEKNLDFDYELYKLFEHTEHDQVD
jgi:superfamily II DNA/RNA helicase